MEGPFKNLKVWQKAMELVRLVYQASKAFSSEERFALTDQLRRAVVSIPSISQKAMVGLRTRIMHISFLSQGDRCSRQLHNSRLLKI